MSFSNMWFVSSSRQLSVLSALVFVVFFSQQTSAHGHEDKDKHHAANQLTQQSAEQQSIELQLIEQQLKEAEKDDTTIGLSFAQKTIVVEYADDPNERALGLMYRRSMCDDCGMLFKFDSKRIASIWMKNTYIPLDLAYIDTDGTIIDIHQLEPFNLTAVSSSQPVLFALEMNLGWYAKHDIKIGQKIEIQGHSNK